MILLDQNRLAGLADAQNINHWIRRLYNDHGGGDIYLSPRIYHIDEPIVLKTGVRLLGQGIATQLRGTSSLMGAVVMSDHAETLERADAWLVSEGVPVRFELKDLVIDGGDSQVSSMFASGCGVHVYGKGFRFSNVQITNTKSHGLVSVGSVRGGQEGWRDEPEAEFDVRISRCKGDGFLMRGPHDSIIRQAIISHCKQRGMAVETNGIYNGACDIEFCHAYGTDDVAIDLAAKVKAGFLQGDTGTGAGVRIGGSEMTYVDRIECFKTRGTVEDYALDIRASFTQIGLARIRADWGTGGVRMIAPGCQIGQLDVDGKRNTGGKVNNTPNDATGVYVAGNINQIGTMFVRNFDAGVGVHLETGCRGSRLSGLTKKCATHLIARDLQGCDLSFRMHRRGKEMVNAYPLKKDRFDLLEI
nr:glycosyl hydrolase family 28-related protein [uncultured Hyphomonas sp.]